MTGLPHGGWTVVALAAGLLLALWLRRLVAAGLLAAALAVVAGLVPALLPGPPAGGPLAPGAPVPAAYRPWITRAGSLCPEITPALLAAQLSQESGFNPRAVSVAGAQGIAQFMPSTWRTWATDGDGDGVASVWNPADAITAQGRFMCHLAAAAREQQAAGRVRGDVTALALAGYNAGFARVQGAGGIPAIAETRAYVSRITALTPSYTDPARL